MKQQSAFGVDTAEGTTMTERDLRELEVRIARYRFLRRETTDPLAEHLLDSIVTELEDDLKSNGIVRSTGPG